MNNPPAVNRFQAEVYHRRTVMLMLDCKPEAFRKDFKEWLTENYHVWEAFEREANNVWNRGKRHYSQRTIWEYLRHESATREVSGPWKMNDWYVKDCARLYVMMHPDRDGFFEFRNGQSAVRAA